MGGLLSYSFIWNALIISVLSSILCAMVGTWVVVKRKVLISGGITHASFGGIGLAYFLSINPLIGGLIFAIVAAIGIELSARSKKLREDSAIGIFWSLGMALGIVFIYLTPGYAPDLMGYLFGNILTVNKTDIIISSAVLLFFLIWFIINYYKIVNVSFDEDYARACGVKVNNINMLMMMITAVVVILNIKISGVILVLSLLSIGQSAANLITHNYKNIILLSFAFNIFACVTGIIVSWYLSIPCGAAIIFILAIIYIIVKLLSKLKRKNNQ